MWPPWPSLRRSRHISILNSHAALQAIPRADGGSHGPKVVVTALVAGEAAVADGATVSRRTVLEDEGRVDGSYRGRRADSARLRSQQSRTALEDGARVDGGVRTVLSRQTVLDDGGHVDGSSRMALEDRAHEEVAGGARGSSSRGRSCPHRRCRDGARCG